MSNSTLLGSNRVTETEVLSVPAVQYTRSFHPVHHRDFISVIKESIDMVGLDIVKEEYVLAAEGKKMFGVYDLNNGSSELCWSIGIRNSMDKSMSLGITAGALPQRKGMLCKVLTKKAYQNVLVCLIIEQISDQRKELNYGKIINWINRVFN